MEAPSASGPVLVVDDDRHPLAVRKHELVLVVVVVAGRSPGVVDGQLLGLLLLL